MLSGIYPAESSGSDPAFPGSAVAGIIPRMAIADRIADRLRALGITPNAASVKAGLPRDAVRDILQGKSKHPRADTLLKLAGALECELGFLLDQEEMSSDLIAPKREIPLPIRYEVAAGTWLARDDNQLESFGIGEALPSKLFADARQWLERVRGDSMNRLIPDGALAHVVDIRDFKFRARHDDLVVVERTRAQGAFVERTIKQVALTPEGIQLWPRSFSERWNEPIALDGDLKSGEDATVAIVGLVIRAYMPFRGLD